MINPLPETYVHVKNANVIDIQPNAYEQADCPEKINYFQVIRDQLIETLSILDETFEPSDDIDEIEFMMEREGRIRESLTSLYREIIHINC